MATHSEPIYGINTGFELCNVKISNENLSKLQENLVKSHACGMGGRSAKGNRVKLMLCLKFSL
jgi:histidine ammonia-lyase